MSEIIVRPSFTLPCIKSVQTLLQSVPQYSMRGPTSRDFAASKRLGDRGETEVARLLARQVEQLESFIGQSVTQILVKRDTRSCIDTAYERLGRVEIVYAPRHRAEQRYGDVILLSATGAQTNLEVKSEQYGLKVSGREEGTPNLSCETHDIISPLAYEQLWTGGKRDRASPTRLTRPSTHLAFAVPQAPAWFGRPGGHLKSKADVFVHLYARSGHCVLLFLEPVKRNLAAGAYDSARWFASCTLQNADSRCLEPGGRGVEYYTVGKLLPVAALQRSGSAVVLTAP